MNEKRMMKIPVVANASPKLTHSHQCNHKRLTRKLGLPDGTEGQCGLGCSYTLDRDRIKQRYRRIGDPVVHGITRTNLCGVGDSVVRLNRGFRLNPIVSEYVSAERKAVARRNRAGVPDCVIRIHLVGKDSLYGIACRNIGRKLQAVTRSNLAGNLDPVVSLYVVADLQSIRR